MSKRNPITDTDRIDLLQLLAERPGFVGDVTIAGSETHALQVHAGPAGDFQDRVCWGDDLRSALDKAIRRERRRVAASRKRQRDIAAERR